MIINW